MGYLSEIGKSIKKSWNSMSTKEKIKIVVRVACSSGAGLIGGVLSRKYVESENSGFLESALVVTTAVGLSWKAGDMAYESWSNYIDVWDDIRKNVNELGDEVEAEEVVG